MVLEITDDPYAAMHEEQHTRLGRAVGRLHDVKLDRLPVLRDRALRGRHAGHVHRRPGLQAGEDILGLRLRQFPKRTGVLVQLGEKRTDRRIDMRINGAICSRLGGLYHHIGS